MAFFDFFSSDEDSVHSRLFYKFKEQFKEAEVSDDEIVKYTCIAGLFARVCYADMEVKVDEVEHIRSSLSEWIPLDEKIIDWIARISINEVVDLAGTENHLYVRPLFDIMTVDERFELLKALFAVSASDGVTCHNESEEINLICKGLRLDNRYFVAARATVVDKMASLKSVNK